MAALEFGAAVVIDLGVASGSVEVKAGIYFHWLEPVPDKGSIDLAGYVRIHGELTVIAIISVSLTFNLQLGYHKEAGKSTMYGEATLVVEVDVLAELAALHDERPPVGEAARERHEAFPHDRPGRDL